MQYLYSQEEHDRVKTDHSEFERRVDAAVQIELKSARFRVAKVIQDFFIAHGGEMLGSCYREALISYATLKTFADALHKANHTEEKCDKPTASVIQ